MINSLMPDRFHFCITLQILAIRTLPQAEIIFSRSYLISTSTNYIIFPNSHVFFFFSSTYIAHHTCKLPLSLCFRGFGLGFKPCAHINEVLKVMVTKHICTSDLSGKLISRCTPDLLNHKLPWCTSDTLRVCQRGSVDLLE